MTEAKKYLGIDWGSKRIGLAIGDNLTKISNPYKTVSTIKEIKEIVKREDIDVLVIGQPKSLDNNTPKPGTYTWFIKEIKKEIDLPLVLIDERMTSKEADSMAGDKKTKAGRDEIAAMLILDTHFSKL